MGAQESEDDEATHSVVKAPPLMRPKLTIPPNGGLTSEKVATLAHDLLRQSLSLEVTR